MTRRSQVIKKCPRVRLLMPLTSAAALADLLEGDTAIDAERVLDQLWLRSVLVEQWRRTRISERAAFEQRADRVLAALDP